MQNGFDGLFNRAPFAALVLLLSAALTGCAWWSSSASSSRSGGGQDAELTVGSVQSEIRVGMRSVEVAEALGSPNIVQSDSQGEVWIYDRISREARREGSGVYGTLILFGFGRETQSETRSTKTLTVIIKFDENQRVREFDYHASKF